MASKFYVVWNGRKPGIYTNWNECKLQVDQFPGARYKSFKTRSEAEAAFGQSNTNSRSTNSSEKKSESTGAKNSNSKQASTTLSNAQVEAIVADVKIFTDGACEPNPGEAGSGVAIYRNGDLDELWSGLYQAVGTNNTAELNAFHQALVIAQEDLGKKLSVAIFCDSKYTIQCVTQWAVGWEKNGWKKRGGEIKNLAIIQQAFALYQEVKDKIQVFHVNGHVGIEGNELADRMSMLAISHAENEFKPYQDSLDVNFILSMKQG